MLTNAITLRVDKAEIRIGDLRLLSSISFDVDSGQALILRGANGIGKTTLLRALTGLSNLAEGTASLGTRDEFDVYDIAPNAHYLGHKNGLKADRTVANNLSFFRDFLGSDEWSLDSVFKTFNLLALQHLPVRVLSAGQARRVAFARLKLAERRIWFLDEPTASLDTDNAQFIEDLCRGHLDGGGIIVAASHLPFLDQPVLASTTLDLGNYVPKQRWVGESDEAQP